MAKRFEYTGATIDQSRRYRHVVTRDHYRALHPIVVREADLAPLVVYQRVDIENDDTIWARPLMEFLERFEVVKPHEYTEHDRPSEARSDGDQR